MNISTYCHNLPRYLYSPRGKFGITAFLLGIALPTSTFLLNLSLILVVGCLFRQRAVLQHLKQALRSPLIWLPLLLFLMLVLSLLIHDNSYGLNMVKKYTKLLYILPLTLFFLSHQAVISAFIMGFLSANSVILALSLLVGLTHIPLLGIEPSNPFVFKLHITHNFFMVLAALCWLSLAISQHGWKRWIYTGLVILASCNVLFMVQGRTGYVALVVGLGSYLLLSVPSQQRIKLLLCGFLLTMLLIWIPNPASERIKLGINEIRSCLSVADDDDSVVYNVCNNSMGQRTTYTLHALTLIKQAPLLGHGAGGFWYYNPIKHYSSNNPHNEYLMETVQTGLIGLTVFLAWMFYCFRVAYQQPITIRHLFIAVLLAYLACHLFNSFLLDSSEGHLFVIITAILAKLTIIPNNDMSSHNKTKHPSKNFEQDTS